MRTFVTTFLLTLFSTTLTFGQWININEPGLDAQAFQSGSQYTVVGDTLFSSNSTGIYVSTDFGFSFDKIDGIDGQISGLYAHGGDLYGWTSSNTLYRVEDNTPELLWEFDSFVYGVAQINGKLIVFENGQVQSASTDDHEFETVPLFVDTYLIGSGTVGNTLYILLGSTTSNIYKYYKTTDGETWTFIPMPAELSETPSAFHSFDGTLYAVVNDQEPLIMSEDGENWSAVDILEAGTNRPRLVKRGQAIIFGNSDGYIYRAEGQETFKEFVFNDVVRRFFGNFYAMNDLIYNLATNELTTYDYNSETWESVLTAPFIGDNIVAGPTKLFSSKSTSTSLHLSEKNPVDWIEAYKDEFGSAGIFKSFVELESGRMVAHQQNTNTIFYSDDGENWTENTSTMLQIEKMIARNDSIFAGGMQGIYLSEDGGETWTQVLNGVNGSNLSFFGNNAIFAGFEVFSLSDFSELIEFQLNTNNGVPTSLDTLNNFMFYGTPTGLFRKAVDAGSFDSPTGLNFRILGSTGQLNILGIERYDDLLVAVTNQGVFYTGDAGETFAESGDLIPRGYDVFGDTMYTITNLGYFKTSMASFSAAPIVETLGSPEITRVDTVMDVSVKAQVEPRNTPVSVHFEYGEYTGTALLETNTTTPQMFSAQSEAFEVTGNLEALIPPKRYAYRAIIAFNDQQVVGDFVEIPIRQKKHWERINPTDMLNSFRDVLITRKGSIIAWGDAKTIRSIDNGETWEELNTPARTLTMIQAKGDTLFAGSVSGTFFYSVNEGGEWIVPANENIPSTLGGNTRIWALTYDPVHHSYYAVKGEPEQSTNNALQFIRSTNAGDNWKLISTSYVPEGRRPTSLYADSSGVLWVGTEASLENENFLVRTADSTNTWEGVLQAPSVTGVDPYDMIQIGTDTLFMNTEIGPYISFDGGDTFAFASSGSENDIRRLSNLGTRYDHSDKFGFVGITNNVLAGFESGSVQIGVMAEAAFELSHLKEVGFYGDVAEIEIGEGTNVYPRAIDVSENNMVLMASNNGLWRYIPGATALPSNPDADEVRVVTSNQEPLEVVTSFELRQNYPNPFNPGTNIEFTIPRATVVSLEIYSITGQKVATIMSEQHVNAGLHSVYFDGSSFSSGQYLYRLSAGKEIKHGIMTLIK